MAFKNVNSANVVSYWNAKKAKKNPRLYKLIFPEKKQLGIKLEYIKGANNKTITLSPHALDSTTKRLAIEAIQENSTKMLLFKNEKQITEELRQDLIMAEAAKNTMAMQTIENRIFDEMSALPNGAEVVADMMMGQILSTGLVVINENGVGKSYDYGVVAGQKVTLLTTAKWSDTANADPVTDITTGQDYIEVSTGTRPKAAVCKLKTWNYLKNNAKIKLALGITSRVPSTSELAGYLMDQCGIVVMVYNEKYTNSAGATADIFPDEIFTLIPDPMTQNPVGYTTYGTTPEEANRMGGRTGRDLTMCGDAQGIAVSTYDEKEIEIVKASALMMPSGEAVNQIYILTVHS